MNDIFYVAFYQDYLTERGKALCQKFSGKFDQSYNWFEFPSLYEAKEFVMSFNGERRFGRIDVFDEHVTEFFTYQATLIHDGPPFDGKDAGEIFTLLD